VADRTRTWALALLLVTAVLAVANGVLTVIGWADLKSVDSYTNLAGSFASVFYATLGVLVIVRAGNRIGWFLIAVALNFAAMCLTSSYAVVAIASHPSALPAGRAVGTVSEWLFLPLFALMALMLLVFPTGRLPSARWRPALTVVLTLVTLEAVLFVLAPRQVALPAPGGVSLVYDNPAAVGGLGTFGSRLGSLNGLAVTYLVLLVLALAALVTRYRQGNPEVRHQILWIVLTVGAGLALQVIAAAAQLSCGCTASPVAAAANVAQGVVVIVGVPLAITIAILKYGLYQIETIVNRALVYSMLTLTLGAVYLGLVLVLQVVLKPITTQSDVAVAGSTLTAAALFRPARLRIQAAVDRRFYRKRYDATRTLDDFAARLRQELDLNAVASDLRSAVDDTWQPAHISLWLRHQSHP
jgi:hypothetical protein